MDEIVWTKNEKKTREKVKKIMDLLEKNPRINLGGMMEKASSAFDVLKQILKHYNFVGVWWCTDYEDWRYYMSSRRKGRLDFLMDKMSENPRVSLQMLAKAQGYSTTTLHNDWHFLLTKFKFRGEWVRRG